MPSRETIAMLRFPLLILLVALLVAAAAVFTSLQSRTSQSVVYGSASATLAQARSKLQSAQAEEKNLQAYAGSFKGLAARGLFTEEKRLDWLEHMKRLAAEHHLIALEYHLDPQRSLSPGASAAAPNIDVLASPLRLKISLLHEEDLLNFLNALRNLPQGFYSVDKCAVQKASADSARDGANLTAECAMEWISFKPKKAQFNAS